MPKRSSFRELLIDHKPLVIPTAHDALSARMIERAGYPAVGIAGSAMLAAQHALPDIGLAGLGEMIEGARVIVRGTSLPWGADADDGFGDVRNVVYTVRTFERERAGQIVIEDQDRATKRPGEAGSRTLISQDAMTAKLRAALATRDDADFMIVARTDAIKVEGMDQALRRADAYLAAGADAILVPGLETPDELRHVGERFRGSEQMLAVGEARVRGWPPPSDLYDLGYTMISYPGLLISRVQEAMAHGLRLLDGLACGDLAPLDWPDMSNGSQGLADMLDLATWEGLTGDPR